MHVPDALNGFFESIGGVLVWLNVRRLVRDRDVKGVDWRVMFFFAVWGWWNLFYYPHLHQWVSTAGAAVMAVANTVWIVLVIKLRKEKAF